MPSTFLTFKERERLTSFPDEMLQWDLITYFTAGYTDLVFALFDVLGMQFSPRLRDLGDRQLYKLKTDPAIYPRLDARLTGRIDLTRLLEGWDDLVRVAGSLKRGYVT